MKRGAPLKRTPLPARTTPLQARTPLPATRGGLKPRSQRRAAQERSEAKVKRDLYSAAPWCARCGKPAQHISGLDKHELLSRARGGDPCDPANCVLLCRYPCHYDVTFRHHLIPDADRWVLSAFGGAA